MTVHTIKGFYEKDHDTLDELLKNYQKLKRLDFARAKPFFREFLFGLRRHILWEEEILFPLFESKTGVASGGPTEVMRSEHRQILRHLDAVHEKVRVADPESDEEETLLINLLTMHNQKEEQVLYPTLDTLLGEDDLEAVFRRMNDVPEERYRICCGGAVAS